MWIGKDGGSSTVVISLGDIPRGNEVSETKCIDDHQHHHHHQVMKQQY